MLQEDCFADHIIDETQISKLEILHNLEGWFCVLIACMFVYVYVHVDRFATLASRMEQYIQGQSRDLVDKAYTRLVS